MARMAVLQFTKEYETVVEAFKTMVKNAVVTEREENGRTITDIEGDFEHFVLEDMDMWSVHIKIEIKDNQIKDDEDRESRALIASALPQISGAMFSPTVAFVYKRVETTTKTTTIVEKFVDGVQRERDEQVVTDDPVYEWEDITREFAKKVRIQ